MGNDLQALVLAQIGVPGYLNAETGLHIEGSIGKMGELKEWISGDAFHDEGVGIGGKQHDLFALFGVEQLARTAAQVPGEGPGSGRGEMRSREVNAVTQDAIGHDGYRGAGVDEELNGVGIDLAGQAVESEIGMSYERVGLYV